jgi:hypothetical protein
MEIAEPFPSSDHSANSTIFMSGLSLCQRIGYKTLGNVCDEGGKQMVVVNWNSVSSFISQILADGGLGDV